jgi:hypothetical protein
MTVKGNLSKQGIEASNHTVCVAFGVSKGFQSTKGGYTWK